MNFRICVKSNLCIFIMHNACFFNFRITMCKCKWNSKHNKQHEQTKSFSLCFLCVQKIFSKDKTDNEPEYCKHSNKDNTVKCRLTEWFSNRNSVLFFLLITRTVKNSHINHIISAKRK